ncbi:hypothetical protein [Halegenticoccus soli]|uniref:hypothetical protein n=1 Tax=Halegenticoccus soli TaxID=1985678 RepID=UPI000C6DDF6B|nr:hypothetical protein [Halegenticoccus soli]
MSDPPSRQTKAAQSRRRWTWSGLGEGAQAEKDGFGLFIDDVVFVFAEISVLSLPVLYAVMVTEPQSYFGAKTSALVAWMTMVAVGALIRGGWVTPLGSDVPGWVSLTPSLILLRFAYYNLLLGGVAYGGAALALEQSPLGSIVFAVVGSSVAIGAFPAVADAYFRAVRRYG